MKQIVLAAFIAVGLSACADNRSSAHPDATSWEQIHYKTQDKQ